jgi:hypothetical protein
MAKRVTNEPSQVYGLFFSFFLFQDLSPLEDEGDEVICALSPVASGHKAHLNEVNYCQTYDNSHRIVNSID